jgi:hypothetical protein
MQSRGRAAESAQGQRWAAVASSLYQRTVIRLCGWKTHGVLQHPDFQQSGHHTGTVQHCLCAVRDLFARELDPELPNILLLVVSRQLRPEKHTGKPAGRNCLFDILPGCREVYIADVDDEAVLDVVAAQLFHARVSRHFCYS